MQKIVLNISKIVSENRFYVKLISYTLVLMIFFSVSYKIYKEWSNVDWKGFEFNFIWLFPVLVLSVLAYFVQIYNWRRILSLFNVNISFLSSFRIEMVSQIGKYVPGKIGLVFTKVLECNRIGIDQKTALICSSYHIGIGLYFQFLVGLITAPVIMQVIAEPRINFSYPYLLFAVIIGLIFIYPSSFLFFINLFLKIMGKNTIDMKIDFWNWFVICSTYIFLAILSGFIGFFMINTFSPIPFDKVIFIIGTRSWAFLLGLLNVFAPSGIGLREGILTGLYSFIIPAPLAFGVAILSRLVGTIVEWCLIGTAFLIKIGN